MRPVVCFDEGTKPMVKLVTEPIPLSCGEPEITELGSIWLRSNWAAKALIGESLTSQL